MKRESEEVQSGPVTHGGAGDPLGEGVAKPGDDATAADDAGGDGEG